MLDVGFRILVFLMFFRLLQEVKFVSFHIVLTLWPEIDLLKSQVRGNTSNSFFSELVGDFQMKIVKIISHMNPLELRFEEFTQQPDD